MKARLQKAITRLALEHRADFDKAWRILRRFPCERRTDVTRYLILGISHGLGDIIVSTPAMQFYHEQGYTVLLPCWAQYQPAFSTMSEIDRFITIPSGMHEWGYVDEVKQVADAILDQVGEIDDGDIYVAAGFDKWRETVQRRLPYFRIDPSCKWDSSACRSINVATRLGIDPTTAHEYAGRSKLDFEDVETPAFDIVLSMGSQDRNRRFQAQVVRELADRMKFTIVGGVHDDEREILEGIPSFDPGMALPINHVLSVISRAGLYVGPDSGLTHAATALGVPTIAFHRPIPIYYPNPLVRVHHCDLSRLTVEDVWKAIHERS